MNSTETAQKLLCSGTIIYSLFTIHSSLRRCKAPFLVPAAGVEPARYRYHRILSPARLPIPSRRHKPLNYNSISYNSQNVKQRWNIFMKYRKITWQEGENVLKLILWISLYENTIIYSYLSFLPVFGLHITLRCSFNLIFILHSRGAGSRTDGILRNAPDKFAGAW